MMSRSLRIGVPVLLLLLLLISAVASPARQNLWDFEDGPGGWLPTEVDGGSISVEIAADEAGGDGHALAITGKTPTSFGARFEPWDDWRGFTSLSFDLKVPADAPADIEPMLYIKDHQYLWYQAAPLRDRPSGERVRELTPGQWTTFTVDISESSTAWEPGGHERSWDRVLFYPREFGIRFFADEDWSGMVLVDNLRLTGDETPLAAMTDGKPGPGRGVLQVNASADTVKVYEKFELTFELDRDYENPFDSQVANVLGHFRSADGRRITVPGFFYQDYRRTLTEEGYEKLIPVGAPCWKVRFSASQPGDYDYFVEVNDAWGQLRSRAAKFTVLPDPEQRGLVRISEQDPRYFEYENGQFYFPTGINMRDGGDHAERQKGTYDFDYFLSLFADQGLNFVRTWMCGWWAGIEWSDQYHSRYDGLSRYSMYNAWRLDYAVDLAESLGINLEITLNSHGQFRRDKFDAEWQYNPYSVKNGGFLASPAMFFTSERARQMIQRRNRYIAARWGYSPAIMAWDLVNEVDLVEGYNQAEVAAWHREMAQHLKSVDQHDRLITSHICLYWSYGTELWDLPEIQYIQADAYWKRDKEEGMNECWKSRQQYDKPFLFIEYGPQTADLPISEDRWQRDFRTGMWVSNMIPSAAPGQFWYHREWDEYKLYRYQKGLSAYNAGEDRRGAGLKTVSATASSPRVTVQAMSNGQMAYLYVYDFENMLQSAPAQVPQERHLRDVEVSIPDMRAGRYSVEYWDTIEGQVIATAELTGTGGALKMILPQFAQDLAIKIKPM